MREKGEGKPHSSGSLECFVFAEGDSTLHSAVLQFSSPRLTFPLFLLLLHSSCTTSEMSNFQGWICPSSIELEYHRNVSSPCARVVWFRNVNNLQHQNGWQSIFYYHHNLSDHLHRIGYCNYLYRHYDIDIVILS